MLLERHQKWKKITVHLINCDIDISLLVIIQGIIILHAKWRSHHHSQKSTAGNIISGNQRQLPEELDLERWEELFRGRLGSSSGKIFKLMEWQEQKDDVCCVQGSISGSMSRTECLEFWGKGEKRLCFVFCFLIFR